MPLLVGGMGEKKAILNEFTAGADGTFSIKGLPPGDYTLEAVHEEYGAQTMKLTVAAKETKQIAFTFKAP